MAKKNNHISINELERYCKNTTQEEINCQVSVGDDVLEFVVRPTISLEESIRFIEDVVEEYIDGNDMMVIPIAKEYLISRNLMTYYSNFTMPKNKKKEYELVMNSTPIVETIREHVNQNQLGMIIRAIYDKIAFEEKKMLSAQEVKLNQLTAEISQFTRRMEDLFGNVSGDQMSQFITNMSELSQRTDISTEDLAKAFVNEAKQNND